MGLHLYDYLFIYAFFSIWLLLLYHIVLAYYGYKYHGELSKLSKKSLIENLKHHPFVSVIVPAYNEEKVILHTVHAILNMEYPKECFELIVINDNSSDRTGEILYELKEDYPSLRVINVTPEQGGGRGKAAALNRGLKISNGEYIAVYDADNIPEKKALIYLVTALEEDPSLGCVCGKFRCRNKDRNLLTRFINLETLGFQWLSQAGRWRLFKISTIPGTNFLIRKDLLNEIGGWNEEAITEDTELSIRIYQKGFKIKFFPLSVTWEQEPENWKVWFKQRTRWVKGNIYVIKRYFHLIFHIYKYRIGMDIFYFLSIYFLLISSILISDFIFLLTFFNIIELTLEGPFLILWVLAYVLFVLEMATAVSLEKGENNLKNVFYIALMYLTYSQAWIVLTLRSFFLMIQDQITGRPVHWYKTERF